MNYPKLRRENLEWRAKILRKASQDSKYQAQVCELFHRDILFAFNAFYWTYDVRKRPLHNIPFTTWDYQDDFILEINDCIADGIDRVVEKSRDMGVSWMVILTFHHNWARPSGGGDFLLGSRIEDYVDRKGDMRTLFEKLRYAHYKLPKWLWPRNFAPRTHDNYMKFINPETGATISGESNNANFSTGGRYAGILFDEFAKWESTDESAWMAAGDASPCRIAVSTPFGVGGKYFRLVVDGMTKKLRLHWCLHPEKALGISCLWPPPNAEDQAELGLDWRPLEKLTSPWYEKETERRTPTEISQELDINYIGAGNPVFDGKAGDALSFQLSIPDRPVAIYPIDLSLSVVCSSVPVPSHQLDDRQLRGNCVLLYEDRFPGADFFPDSGRQFAGSSFPFSGKDFYPSDLYAIGVDVSEGLEGGDFASVTVFNRSSRNVAAVYWGSIDEVMLARIVKAISDFFSSPDLETSLPMIGIETNGPGLVTFDRCVELGMTNLFMMPKYDVVNGGVSYRKGWVTTPSSKNELIGAIRSWLIHREGRAGSHRLIGELLSFVRNRQGKAGAKSGCHDDMVISLGICLAMDELLNPVEERKILYIPPSDGKITAISNRELLRVDEPTVLHERIEADALRKQKLSRHFEDAFY